MGDLVIEVDVAVVGGGPGGYSAAFRCAELGLETVGVDFGEPRVSLDSLRKWKAERVVGRLGRGLASVAKAKSVEVIGGLAVFESSRELRVEGDAPQKVRFKHAVIATGSTPAGLPGLALATDRGIDPTGAPELVD